MAYAGPVRPAFAYELKNIEVKRSRSHAHRCSPPEPERRLPPARSEQSMNETRIQVLKEMLRARRVGDFTADDGIVEPGMVGTAIVAGRGNSCSALATPEATWAFGGSPRRRPSVPSSVTRRATSEGPTGHAVDVEIIDAKLTFRRLSLLRAAFALPGGIHGGGSHCRWDPLRVSIRERGGSGLRGASRVRPTSPDSATAPEGGGRLSRLGVAITDSATSPIGSRTGL